MFITPVGRPRVEISAQYRTPWNGRESNRDERPHEVVLLVLSNCYKTFLINGYVNEMFSPQTTPMAAKPVARALGPCDPRPTCSAIVITTNVVMDHLTWIQRQSHRRSRTFSNHGFPQAAHPWWCVGSFHGSNHALTRVFARDAHGVRRF
jgi:hypothetical protein